MIFDLKEKTNKTIKQRFEYLEKLPVRKLETSRHAIGCKLNFSVETNDELIMIVELEDPDDRLNNLQKKKKSRGV